MKTAHKFLEVKDLKTQFNTPEGTVYAVNGVSFSLDEGETLAVVGESGCGKSVTMMSIMKLIQMPPGKIVGGEVIFRDSDLLKLSEDAMEQIRGREIAMIFQDPMTSLNPVLTVGRQITETLRTHTPMTPEQCRDRAAQLLELVESQTQLNGWMITHISFLAACANV